MGRDDNNDRESAFKRFSIISLGNTTGKCPKTGVTSNIRNYIVGGMPVLLEDDPATEVTGLLCIIVTFFLQGTILRTVVPVFGGVG